MIYSICCLYNVVHTIGNMEFPLITLYALVLTFLFSISTDKIGRNKKGFYKVLVCFNSIHVNTSL